MLLLLLDVYKRQSSISGALTICTTRNSPYISSMYRKNKALSEAVLNAYVAATGCRKEYVWETDSMTGNNWRDVYKRQVHPHPAGRMDHRQIFS